MNTDNNDNNTNEKPRFLSMAVPPRDVFNVANDTAAPHRKSSLDATRDVSRQQRSRAAASWASLDKLTQIDDYYPVEPSHVKFPRHLLEDTLERLSEAFRTLSCHVSYAADGLTARCDTLEGITFQVSLMCHQNNPDEVILEIQRITGDSFIFHKTYVSSLLAVVTDDSSEQATTTAAENCHDLNIDGLFSDEQYGNTTEDIETALQLASNLVLSDRWDAQRLGLEALVSLTDTEKSGRETASAVSRMILQSDTAHIAKLRAQLWRLLINKSDLHDANGDVDLLVLQIWGHNLQRAAEQADTTLTAALPIKGLVNTLMQYVQCVDTNPHQATFALQALTALAQCHGIEHDIAWPTVQHAHAMGCEKHQALQDASRQLLTVHR